VHLSEIYKTQLLPTLFFVLVTWPRSSPDRDTEPGALPVDNAGDTTGIVDDDIAGVEVSVRKRLSFIVELKQLLGEGLVGRAQSLVRAGIRECSDETGVVFLARDIRTILNLLVLKRVVVEKYVSTRRIPQSPIEVS
jgi:hypothetical protein